MHKIPVQNYLTCNQIDERANSLELEAAALAPGARKNALIEQARKLRTYADMKRLLSVADRVS
jgi:hypothetical protein